MRKYQITGHGLTVKARESTRYPEPEVATASLGYSCALTSRCKRSYPPSRKALFVVASPRHQLSTHDPCPLPPFLLSKHINSIFPNTQCRKQQIWRPRSQHPLWMQDLPMKPLATVLLPLPLKTIQMVQRFVVKYVYQSPIFWSVMRSH